MGQDPSPGRINSAIKAAAKITVVYVRERGTTLCFTVPRFAEATGTGKEASWEA